MGSRIGILKTQVGTSPLAVGGAAAAATAPAEVPALTQSSSLFAEYAKLLRSKSSEDDLQSTVAELETKVHTVESEIQTLTNQVQGNAFSAASLAEIEAETVKKMSDLSTGVSLETRVEALEKAVSKDRTKVTDLEQTVVG